MELNFDDEETNILYITNFAEANVKKINTITYTKYGELHIEAQIKFSDGTLATYSYDNGGLHISMKNFIA